MLIVAFSLFSLWERKTTEGRDGEKKIEDVTNKAV